MTETATRAGEPSDASGEPSDASGEPSDASATESSDGSASAPETVTAPAGNAPVSAWSKGIAWARRNWLGLTIFAATWLVLLIWWAAYFPGLFSPDSFAYMWQATTSHWDTHHSVLYNSLVWVSLYTTGGIATLTFLQTAGTAASLGYAATSMRRLGAPAWLLLPLSVGVVALPTMGTYVVSLWKDVPYTFVMIFAFGTVCRLIEARLRERVVSTRLLVILGVELLLMCLLRPNGFAAVAGFGVLAAIVLVGTRLKVLAVAAAAVVVSLAANLLIFPAFGVRNSLFDAASVANYHDIAIVYNAHPQEFTADDLRLMETAGPLDSWKAGSYCRTLDALMGSPGWSFDRAEQHSGDFTQLWLRLFKADPGAILDARLCRADVIWKPWRTGPDDWLAGPPVNGFAVTDTIRQIPFYDSAVYAKPLSNRLHREASQWVKAFSGIVAETVEWRGSFWSYVTYLAVLIAFIRRRRLELLAVAALTAANQLTLLPQTPGPGARYMFPPILIAAVAIPIALARTPRPATEPAEATQARLDDRG